MRNILIASLYLVVASTSAFAQRTSARGVAQQSGVQACLGSLSALVRNNAACGAVMDDAKVRTIVSMISILSRTPNCSQPPAPPAGSSMMPPVPPRPPEEERLDRKAAPAGARSTIDDNGLPNL